MAAVMAAERALGREPRDVSGEKVGYDIESLDPRLRRLHFIEVKGRIDGADTITVTTNEALVALNAGERFVLALVRIGPNGFAHEPIYLRKPFDSAPMSGSSQTTFPIDQLIARGAKPH
jgi:hypothetical protein